MQDCHPGNVLLLDNGRLGLIDYGQARRLSVKQRLVRSWSLTQELRDSRRDAYFLASTLRNARILGIAPDPAQDLARIVVALADGKRDEVIRRCAPRTELRSD